MTGFENLECLNTAFTSGAFLCSGENVMVASWGFVGVMWGKKIFIAPVRDSRYTKEFIDKTGAFTISVPTAEMKKAVAFCGSKSGRDYDKWKETGLEKAGAKAVDGVVVGGCGKYFECRVIASLPLDICDLPEVSKWYPTKDKHNLYFGEIVAEY